VWRSKWFCILYFITDIFHTVIQMKCLLVSFNSGLFFIANIGESLIIWKIRIWFIVEIKMSFYSTMVVCIELCDVNFYFENGSSINSKSLNKVGCVFLIVICPEFRTGQYRVDDFGKTHPNLYDLYIEEPFISRCKAPDIDHRFRKLLQSLIWYFQFALPLVVEVQLDQWCRPIFRYLSFA